MKNDYLEIFLSSILYIINNKNIMNTKEKLFSFLENFNENIAVYSSIAPSWADKPLIVFNREYYKRSFFWIINEKFEITLWTVSEDELETYLSWLIDYLYNNDIALVNSKKVWKVENIIDTEGDFKWATIELFLKFKEN